MRLSPFPGGSRPVRRSVRDNAKAEVSQTWGGKDKALLAGSAEDLSCGGKGVLASVHHNVQACGLDASILDHILLRRFKVVRYVLLT